MVSFWRLCLFRCVVCVRSIMPLLLLTGKTTTPTTSPTTTTPTSSPTVLPSTRTHAHSLGFVWVCVRLPRGVRILCLGHLTSRVSHSMVCSRCFHFPVFPLRIPFVCFYRGDYDKPNNVCHIDTYIITDGTALYLPTACAGRRRVCVLISCLVVARLRARAAVTAVVCCVLHVNLLMHALLLISLSLCLPGSP